MQRQWNSTSQVVFAAHFPTKRCQYSNICLQFVLVEQIRMQNSGHVKNSKHALHISMNLSSLSGHGDDGLFQRDN
jgi:hypothetical protein